MGRSDGKMEALAEIQYEIGYRIRVHWETRWQRGWKMKGLCKEDKEGGRLRLLAVTAGHLSIFCGIGTTKYPRAHSLSPLQKHTCRHTC